MESQGDHPALTLREGSDRLVQSGLDLSLIQDFGGGTRKVEFLITPRALQHRILGQMTICGETVSVREEPVAGGCSEPL
ncbi:MAG: hypothetical protein RQ745_01445 [Longimicrobiales bacterium]|nr:hypothetical protein [Longimicrobiales bacterium]